jgi:ferritin
MHTKNLLPKAIDTLLSDAAHAELFASNLYKHIANQMQRVGYFGAAKWFLRESSDELEHYQLLADYANDMGSVLMLPTVEGHTNTISTLRDALETAYDTEVELMRDYIRWSESSDAITRQFLLQFLEKQRKSVGEYGDWLAMMDRAGADNAALLMVDHELAKE